MGSLFSRPICIVAGTLYPAYASFKALESDRTDDDKQWLTYWVVYSLTTSVETVSEQVLSWFPGYYAVKTIFLLWMMLPQTKGAILLYDYFILPMLKKHEPLLDQNMKRLRDISTAYVNHLKARGAKALRSGINALKEGKLVEFLDRTIKDTPEDPPVLKPEDNKTSVP